MTGHVGLSSSLEPPPKQQVPGSFRVREQRERFPEQSSCRGQGHVAVLANHASWDAVLVRLPGTAWLPMARQGAPGSGHCVPCPGSSISAARPCPASHAHHPASLWKPACVPWVPVYEPEALGGRVTPAPEPKLCCPQSLNLACPLWDPTESRAATAGACSPLDCPDYPQPRALGSRT